MMKLYLREDAAEYYREMLDVLRIFSLILLGARIVRARKRFG